MKRYRCLVISHAGVVRRYRECSGVARADGPG